MSNVSQPEFGDSPQKPSEPPSVEPLSRIARRVLGVLVEKAKTTPDQYPMTLAAIVTACNQKSNRDPHMQLDEADVLEALDLLRGKGAVAEVQGTGRVSRYRHHAYDWFGVRGGAAAILIELLLRGPQTAGELRARASRMATLESLDEVKRLLDELHEAGLARPLTPPGRGQQFAHLLYQPHEEEKLTRSLPSESSPPLPAGKGTTSDQESSSPSAAPGRGATESEVQRLEQLVDRLTQRVSRLENELGLEPPQHSGDPPTGG